MSDSKSQKVFFNKVEFEQTLQQVHKSDLLKYGYTISHHSRDPFYVKKGDELCHIQVGIKSLGSTSYHEIPILAPCSGYCFKDKAGAYRGYKDCEDGTLIAIIYTDSVEVADMYEMKASLEVDDFSGEQVIEWEKVCGEKADSFNLGAISIELTLLRNKPAFKVNCMVGKDKYRKGDIFEILLSNGEVLNFILDNNPRGSIGSISKCRYCEFYIIIDKDIIERLTINKVLKARLRQKSNANIKVVGNNDYIGCEELSQLLFHKYVVAYKKTLMENSYVWESTDEQSSADPCYVYLMVDIANGYHKIGISSKPEYRERTLQSEKPTIEKVCAKQYPSRIIAEAIESALHKAFEAKRIRGEWFNLSEQDVIDLKITLS